MLLAYCKSYEGHSKIGNDFPASYWNQDSKIFTIFEVSFLHNKFRRHLIFRMSASTSQFFSWIPPYVYFPYLSAKSQWRLYPRADIAVGMNILRRREYCDSENDAHNNEYVSLGVRWVSRYSFDCSLMKGLVDISRTH